MWGYGKETSQEEGGKGVPHRKGCVHVLPFRKDKFPWGVVVTGEAFNAKDKLCAIFG